MPEAQHDSNESLRKTVFDALKASAPEGTTNPEDYFKRNGGINVLGRADKETANNFCDELEKYGMFLVRCGEVEAWLKSLGAPSKSNGWRAAIFKAMGSDPKDENYVKPEKGDVWDFIGDVSKWLKNPKRKGIPE